MHDWLVFSLLGLVQGITEFLPISSSGHLIIVRDLLGAQTANGLAVDAVLQVGTMFAVIVYFFKDLLNLAYTALKKISGRPIKAEEGRLLMAILVGTIPGLILGLFLEETMDTLFRSTHLVAYALIAGSLIFFGAEFVSSRAQAKLGIESVGPWRGLLVGLFQSLALIPGMSRSGMTISGGLFLGLSREAAARFGFLLSVPIIAGAGLKKLLELGSAGEIGTIGASLLLGSAVAFVSGLAAIHMLLKFLRTHPLHVFAIYRVLLAAGILFLLPSL